MVGTIEGLHFNKSIWAALTKEQRYKAVVLCQGKYSQRVEKAALTFGLTVPMSKVSDKIDRLACTIKSCDTKSLDHS